MRTKKRSRTLIQPRIQLRLTLVFVGLCALALTLQLVLFTNALSNVALRLPNDGPVLMGTINPTLLRVCAVSFGLFLPLAFAVGVLTTFRIAGPLHRFEQFLHQIRRGERPADCRLREGDELQTMAHLINEVTAPLRAAPQQQDVARDGQEALSSRCG